MTMKDKIISLIPLILIILFLFIVISTFDYLMGARIRNNLIYVIPLFLGINLFLIIFSFVFCFKDIKKLFKKIDRKTWIILLIIFIFGLSLRTFVAPHTHNIYFDEHVYMNVGQNIANEGKGVMTLYGTPEKCFEYHYIKQPIGYPFLLGSAFKLFGTSETNAHYTTAIISSLAIMTVFLISYLLFENEKISMISTFIFTLVPISIIWAPTTSSDTAFVFFMGLTIFGFLSYFKNSKNRLLFFSFVCLAYTVQMRPEGLILLIPVISMFFLFKKDLFVTINKKKVILILLIFSILIIPHLLHTNSYKEHSWDNPDGVKFDIKYVGENFQDNSLFFFENTRFPVVFTAFALIGLFLGKMLKEKTFLAMWFLIFFGTYLLFYAGSFNYSIDVRYSLTMYIQLSIIGGLGAYIAACLLKRITKEKIAFCLVVFIITLSFIPFCDDIGLYKSEDSYSKTIRPVDDFFADQLKEIEDDSWVFTDLQPIALINGKKALKISYASDVEIVNKIFAETDNVYFFNPIFGDIEYTEKTYKLMSNRFNLVECSPKNRSGVLYKIKGWK